MTPHQLLRATCRSDGRSITANPWAVTIDGASYACATDGYRALIFVDPEPRYPPAPDATPFARILRQAPLFGAHSHEVARGELLAAIGDGEMIHWGQQCTQCAGTGVTSCEPGQFFDCENCHGRGTQGGSGYSRQGITALEVKIGQRAAIVDTQLLWGPLTKLQGDPIGVAINPGNALYFFRPEWVLAVATLLARAIDPLRPQIHARPVSPPSPEAAP